MAELKGHYQRWPISTVWLTAILILITQNAVPVVGDSDCLRCEDFNRQTNKQFPCARKHAECGHCMPGFILDSEDNRLCFALEILEVSENVAKDRGSEVYLPCKFNARVDCRWKKGGKEVTIDHPYKWRYGNGVDTDDCSINIECLSNTDTGRWVCSNRANAYVDSIHSRDIVVSITPFSQNMLLFVMDVLEDYSTEIFLNMLKNCIDSLFYH